MIADLQQMFRDAVLGDDDGALATHVTAPGGAAARIAVYRNTVQGSLVEILAAAFPVTRRIVGPAFFANLARRFARDRPPRLPQLSAYGGGFPAFAADEIAAHGLGYLADVARLEWARAESYFAADAPALDPAALTALDPEALDGAVLALHPATRLVRSPYPIHRIWQVNQPAVGDVPAVDMATAEDVLLTRAGGRVALRRLSAGDASFVIAASEGRPFGDAVAQALGADPGFDLESALKDHLIGGTFGG